MSQPKIAKLAEDAAERARVREVVEDAVLSTTKPMPVPLVDAVVAEGEQVPDDIEAAKPLTEQERIDALNPSDTERLLGTYDAIVAVRQAEQDEVNRKRAVAQKIEQDKLAPRPSLAELIAKAEQSNDVADRLGVYGIAVTESQQTYEQNRIIEAKELARPVLARARDLVERWDAAKKLMKPKVDALASVDVLALRKQMPARTKVGSLITNVDSACGLIVQARELSEALTGNVGDLRAAIRIVEQYSAIDVYDRAHSDPEVRLAPINQNVRASIRALEIWNDRVAPIVTSIEDRCVRLVALEQKVAADLTALGPLPKLEPTAPRPTLPVMPPHVGGDTTKSSFVDFDPREAPVTWVPQDPRPQGVEPEFGRGGISHTTFLPPVTSEPKKPSPEVK
jgi:hypothetical protein